VRNYIINPDDTRTFTNGFHVQIEETTMKKAVAVLTSYNSKTSARAHIKDTSGEIESKFRKAYKKLSVHNKLKFIIRKHLMFSTSDFSGVLFFVYIILPSNILKKLFLKIYKNLLTKMFCYDMLYITG
jgi:hypothetical protein